MAKKVERILLILFIILIIWNKFLYAHNAEKIHPFSLTGKAEELLQESYQNEEYKELERYFDKTEPSGYDLGGGNYNQSVLMQGTLGSIKADEIGFLIPAASTLWHFYNPITQGGFRSGIENAVVNSGIFWRKAIELYGERDKEKAYEYFGVVIHHLEDMSAVPHVYLDQHWLEEYGYENYWWPEDEQGQRDRLQELGIVIDGYPKNINQPPAHSYPWGGLFELDYDDFIHQMAIETYEAVRIRYLS